MFINPQVFYEQISMLSIHIREYFGAFYLWLGLGCVLFLLAIACLPLGKIRLGKEPPEFSTLSWIAMLYSAGMGAGILLRAVQEPVFMLHNTPIDTLSNIETIALEYTFYQWGFTAWAFYVFFAVIMGYYLFVRKKSILLSTTFQKQKQRSWIKLVDLLTVLTTVIGIVAAIGLGTEQIEGGLTYFFELQDSYPFAIIFTLLIFALSFYSAYRGVNRGIKYLSNINIGITILLLLFVFLFSDIIEIFSQFSKAIYTYIIDFIPMSLAIGKYNPGQEFLTSWTYYYWAFWLAWAPFTGIFIARISRGRSLRQIIFGAIIIPSVGSFFWFTVFGSSAFELIGQMPNYAGEFDNVFSSIFVFLSHYPLYSVTAMVTILLLVGFLVTSADSAIYVLSMFSDHGKEQPKKSHRLIWAILMLLLTEAILILSLYSSATNVLSAVEKLLIITSLPFAFLTVIIAIQWVIDYWQNRKRFK